MTYDELLQQKEWWQKRNEILDRDYYRCKDCGCLGFHNGYNYMKLNCIEEVDTLLEGWTFNGVEFSKFWSDIPTRKPYPCKDIKFERQYENDGIFVYELNLLNTTNKAFTIFEYPEMAMAVSRENINTLNATMYKFGSSIKKNDSSESTGWAYLFEFPCTISNDIYVSIEYSMPYIIEIPYERIIFNITFGNRVIFIRFTLSSFPLKGLNVHHTYYTRGSKPWEYENDALVTLCEDCHKKRHETSQIPLYDSNKRLISNLIPCDRCGGSGYLPQYSHVEHGICFKCYGEGVANMQ